MEGLTEEERRALRGSKFAPLPSPPPPPLSQPRQAHPGGPLMTNKAAALAKFLERKLQEPGGLASINPDLLNLAVKNAKDSITASTAGPSNSGRKVQHVTYFGNLEVVGSSLLLLPCCIELVMIFICHNLMMLVFQDPSEEVIDKPEKLNKKKKKKKKKNKKQKIEADPGTVTVQKKAKKLRL